MRILEVTNFQSSSECGSTFRVAAMAVRGQRLVSPIEIAAWDSGSHSPVHFQTSLPCRVSAPRLLRQRLPLDKGDFRGVLARESKPSRRCVPRGVFSRRHLRATPPTEGILMVHLPHAYDGSTKVSSK